MKKGNQKSKGKTVGQKAAYKQKGAKSPKVTKRKSNNKPATTASGMKGRRGVDNRTVKNSR